MNQYFSNKKTSVSFVLSLLVFFIHFRVFSVFDNAWMYTKKVDRKKEIV